MEAKPLCPPPSSVAGVWSLYWTLWTSNPTSVELMQVQGDPITTPQRTLSVMETPTSVTWAGDSVLCSPLGLIGGNRGICG